MGLKSSVTDSARTVSRTTLNAAGAVVGAVTGSAAATGGAVIGAGTGAIRGAATGAVAGADSGSRSTPAVILTVAALGAVGIVDWPLALAAGGTALLVNRLTHDPPAGPELRSPTRTTAAKRGVAPAKRTASASGRKPRKSAPRKSAT